MCGLRLAVARRPGIQLLDQGLFQQLSSIRFSASRSIELSGLERIGRRCLEAAGGNAVVFVEVDPQTALRRLAARSGNVSRLEKRLLREAQHVELAAADRALAEARSAIAALAGSGVPIETTKNEDGEDLEAMARDLARRLGAGPPSPEPG